MSQNVCVYVRAYVTLHVVRLIKPFCLGPHTPSSMNDRPISQTSSRLPFGNTGNTDDADNAWRRKAN